MLVFSEFSCNPALMSGRPAASSASRIANTAQQNYCIYTQLFDFGLQALKAIKFGHLAMAEETRLNNRQVHRHLYIYPAGVS